MNKQENIDVNTPGGIKCSDPRIFHEYGRGHILQVTLQDEGRQAAKELCDAYAGGYLDLIVQRG